MILLQPTLILSLLAVQALGFSSPSRAPFAVGSSRQRTFLLSGTENALDRDSAAPTDRAEAGGEEPISKAPTLNGKIVLPLKAMINGLKGHEVAAVYAVINSNYKRGKGTGWGDCEYVGLTRNLYETLQLHLMEQGEQSVSHVRALSFLYPQVSAMEEVVSEWRKLADAEGAVMGDWVFQEAMKYLYDEEEEDDDDDEDDWSAMEMAAEALRDSQNVVQGPDLATSEEQSTIVSPFAESKTPGTPGEEMPFTRENVDRILEEVRPYLISDGGNVSVESVDEETRNVYLVLEGACGSCPSSTVTMQIGIERVLKENFPDLGEVVPVQEEGAEEPKELTWKAVEDEISRMRQAMTAMGAVVEIVSVDPIGQVEIRFRGASRVQQGLELALLDVPFVKNVTFVM